MDAVRPKVVRWAALIEELARAQGLPEGFVVAALCAVHKESGGDPTALNASGAHGLTQQKPKWFDRRYTNPREHLAAYVRVMAGYLKQARGYLPTANFAWASGPAAVAIWTQTGQTWGVFKNAGGKSVTIPQDKAATWVPTHLEYVDHLYEALWPLYSGWYAGWKAAGRPVTKATVEGPHKGQLTLAVDVAPGASSPSPYDGTHRWLGFERRYDRSEAQANGYRPEALAPSQDIVPGPGRAQQVARFVVSAAVSVAAAAGLLKAAQVVQEAQARRAVAPPPPMGGRRG
jgi:hypothetical protein